MTEEPPKFTIGNEQWLTFWLARDLIIARLNVSIAKAQKMLTELRTSKEVRVLPINPPGTSVLPKPETDGSEQFLFSEADLLHLANQQAPQKARKPKAHTRVHRYRHSGDAALVKEGRKLVANGMPRLAAAKQLAPKATGGTLEQRIERLRKFI